MSAPTTEATTGPARAYSAHRPQPLRGHIALTLTYAGGVSGVAMAFRRSRRPLPEHLPARDLVLMSIGTYKLSRMISKDRITSFLRAPFTRYKGESDRPSEVLEEARGAGLQRSLGELLVCPYCLAQWVGTAFVSLYLFSPRLARLTASLFAVVAGSDLLQEAWVAVDKRA